MINTKTYKLYEDAAAVKLFSYTTIDEDYLKTLPEGETLKDVQDLIAYCAKVSNPSAQFDMTRAERLIKYLIDHKHWSPLEMADATVEVDVTRDIGRQILRHVTFRFQEFSQRYAEVTEQGDRGMQFVLREARLQDQKNRQNSIETEDLELQKAWLMKQTQIIHEAEMAYKWAIQNGIAKEQARVVLPEGLTMSRMYMKGSLRSWIHYVDLRGNNGTQKEHMLIARMAAEAISKIFPMIGETR